MAKILIVDSDSTGSQALVKTLRTLNHDAFVLPRGEQVIEAAKSQQTDLIVLDAMLPGTVCGFEVCRRLRADAELFTVPILMLSAMGGDEEVSHGLSQGADDYVVKPCNLQTLTSRIEALLQSQKTTPTTDELTALPAALATKRELQRSICCPDAFALVCIELLGLREVAQAYGAQTRTRLIRYLAQLLDKCSKDVTPTSFFMGHMGGGYFACITTPADMESFCTHLMKTWNSSKAALLDTLKLKSTQPPPCHRSGTEREQELILDPLICITVRQPGMNTDAKSMFEVVTRLRTKALENRKPGIYFDRRG